MIGKITFALFEWTNKTPAVEALNRAVRIAALEVQRDAIRMAPRDTGTLKRSISIAESPGREGGTIDATVGTNVHYAVYQEFGTRRMAAQPFLGPALERARRKYGGR